jgi:isoleucyl-tRNA synthetase
VKANFRSLGIRYGAAVQEAAKAIAASEPGELVRAVRSAGTVTLAEFEISAEDLVITETPKSGWAVATHDGESVALDLALTPELITQGFIREIIRVIQEERKQSGLHVSDRVHITWNGNAEIVRAFDSGGDQIAQEVLALAISRDEKLALPHSTGDDEQLDIAIKITKA